jgi:Tfp pilus assembly protein FimT
MVAGKMSPASWHGQAGLTLVELMVTLIVGLILTIVAIPSYTAMVLKNSMASDLNALSAQVQLARAEAIKRSTPVILCPSADGGGSCNTTGDPWGHAVSPMRIIYADDNGNGSVDAGEVLLNEANGSGRLLLDVVAPGAGPKAIAFNRKGLLDSRYADFEFQEEHGNTRCLRISVSGRVNIVDGSCP